MNLLTEGQVKFEVGNAFYNPKGQISRDLGVLAARVYRAENGQLRVLDAMAGCGVRSLRYYDESEADWVLANEGNPEVGAVLRANLNEILAAGRGKISHDNADRVFSQCYCDRDYYDLIDLDSFGTPTPYLSTALRALKLNGLLYLTSTDGRTATGHQCDRSLAAYGAFARNHPAAQEQVLRLLIGAVQQQAAILGWGVQPMFSLFLGQTYRVMVRLRPKSALTPQNYGFLGYCHHCGEYQAVSWRKLGNCLCPQDTRSLTLSGPMWLGALHDRDFLRSMQHLTEETKTRDLLQIMAAEADFPPYFYTMGEIGRRGKLDVPKRSRLLQALQEQGYRAVPTSINARAIKTNADLAACIALAKKLLSQVI
ncbi:tRNA (guanine-N1)-methyltransferase [Oscillatoria sp. FACHB-1406]|uniref:tRNA (guanine-N1)-methyltransferase n=1 Tax=Oscillatoria sp. FACHB-1406 TaxID=2692846 RepID=UPI00168668DD|nr:tRNA (guanine-N1)-methyltransferase [Oscillatoria sp. FACHB-1406]MBD2577545.1 tRNA (guanine-N1)-methyltransferase [Oscillatoria sp. FACHB-1406]